LTKSCLTVASLENHVITRAQPELALPSFSQLDSPVAIDRRLHRFVSLAHANAD
jgi:hypothetical protein